MLSRHSFLIPITLVLGLFLGLQMPAGAMEDSDIARLVHLLNPAQVGDEHIATTSPFVGEPASDIAAAIKQGTWFSVLVFAPFLILPQILLVVVIFKFRASKRPGPAATFTHNTRLEILWTAIPVVALLVVAVPITRLLDYQESPPPAIARGVSPFTVEVIGRQYSWVYNYPDLDLRVAMYTVRELPTPITERPEGAPPRERYSAVQESVVFPKYSPVTLFLTSQDVNHAWWVPAFAVKKDTFADRYTHTWFTPTRVGFYKGTCAELCGADHGIMKITATVLEPEDFQRWVSFKRHERDARRVVEALREGEGDEAFAAFVAAGDSADRINALRFWQAYDVAIHTTLWHEAATRPFAGGIDAEEHQQFLARISQRELTLRSLIDNHIRRQIETQRAPQTEGTDA